MSPPSLKLLPTHNSLTGEHSPVTTSMGISTHISNHGQPCRRYFLILPFLHEPFLPEKRTLTVSPPAWGSPRTHPAPPAAALARRSAHCPEATHSALGTGTHPSARFQQPAPLLQRVGRDGYFRWLHAVGSLLHTCKRLVKAPSSVGHMAARCPQPAAHLRTVG